MAFLGETFSHYWADSQDGGCPRQEGSRMIKGFPSRAGAGGQGCWLFISRFTGSVFSWSPCPGEKLLFVKLNRSLYQTGTSPCRGCQGGLTECHFQYIQLPGWSSEDNTELFSDLVNNLDTTHITAAGKHSAPFANSFLPTSHCASRWENYQSKACRRLHTGHVHSEGIL